MKVRPTSRHIWAISLPLIFAGFSETILEVTDVIFLGHYGTTELAAVGLADAIFGVCLFLTVGLADGLQIIVARRAGQGRRRDIGAVFNQGLYLLTAISVVLIVTLQQIILPLTARIISSPEVAAAVDDFLRIFAWAILFQSGNMALSAFYVGISRTRVLIGATATLAVVNIGMDYCLIFGNFGFPELGIRGGAIGSLCAEIAAFLYLTVNALARKYHRTYGLFAFGRWDQALTRKLSSISYPVALDALVGTLRWFAFFLIIEQMGEHALACANIVYSCYTLLLIPVDGFSETACSMVSNLIGQEKPGAIGQLLRRTMSLSYAVVFPFVACVLLFPEQVLSVFSSDPAVVANSVNSLRIVAVATAIVVPADMFCSAVAGAGDTRATFLIELALTICILVYAYVTALHLELSLELVWLAEIIGWLVCLGLSWGWLRSGRWKNLQV